MLDVKLRQGLHAGLAIAAYLGTIAAPVDGVSAHNRPKINCETALNTHELNWCSEQEFDEADATLNAVYHKLLAHIGTVEDMSPGRRRDWTNAVRATQRHWIAFRDRDCGEVVGYEWNGGTGMTGAMLGCKINKTNGRTKELEERMPLE